MAVSAVLRGPSARSRGITVAAALAYGAACAWVSAFPPLWVHLVAPGAALLCGYWLPAALFDAPQPWLERTLLRQDRQVFERLDLDRRLERAPRWMLELIEAVYASVYLLVAAGALVAVFAGREAIETYWTVVLAAGLACYVALPWLRSRPPRTLEPPGVLARRAPRARRLNALVLDTASVRVNTIPSGHVAAALAAALALLPVSLTAASLFGAAAVMVAGAAVAGRYHYVLDCVTGGLVALVAWLLWG